ncbi:MAG: hypothetical protein V3V08_23215, partial [Nannocystaceae bacterium]
MDPRLACQSLTPIGVNGTILAAADGSNFDTVITDGGAAGDHLQFTSKGSQKYLLLGLIDNEDTAAPQEWGYRGMLWNGNDQKNNFEGSFAVDKVHSSFFNVEAVRSGIQAFPWECLPAFGPNDVIDIGLYNDSNPSVNLPVTLLAYAMPVLAAYTPLISVARPMGFAVASGARPV